MELEIFLTLQQLFQQKPEPIFVEIGCHRAEDTLRMLQYVPQAKIYAFEADPRNIAYIQAQQLDQQFQFFGTAVGRYDGVAPFFLSSGHPTDPEGTWTFSSSLRQPKVHLSRVPWCKFEQTVEVPVCTLDTFAQQQQLTQVDFIWMDVQGAEADILAGGQQILSQTHYIYTEYSDDEMYEGQANLDQILSLLPGQWRIVQHYTYDFVVLLENLAMSPAAPQPSLLQRTLGVVKRLLQ